MVDINHTFVVNRCRKFKNKWVYVLTVFMKDRYTKIKLKEKNTK